MIKPYLLSGAIKEDAYYISNSGNTNNSGLSSKSPKIFNDIDSLNFATIKKLKFKRGDVFYGNFTINYSDIEISNYGAGNNPIIDNSEDISILNWINDTGDYWYAETTNPGWVMLNNDFLRCAYSNWLTITSRTSNQITFDTTGLDTNNLIGGYVSIREWDWNMTKYYQITGYSGGTITLDDNMLFTDSGKNFIIINKYQFLSSGINQWVYDDSKIWLRTSEDPSNLKIRKTSREALFTCSGNNLSIENIDFQNTYVTFINNGDYTGLTISNCSFANSKFYGIYVEPNNITPNYVDIQNCTVTNMGQCALNFKIAGGGIIKNNTVSGNGVQTNYPFWYTNTEDTYLGTLCTAVKTVSDNYATRPEFTIENNLISNTAWSAIQLNGSNSTIKNNVISNWNRIFTDGAGIYVVSQDDENPTDNIEIYNNICYCDSIGEDGSWVSAGIYLDLYVTNGNVHHNVVYGVQDNSRGAGYFANTYPTYTTFRNNIIVGCTNGIYLYNNTQEVTNYIYNNQISTRKSDKYCWSTNIADETLFFKDGGYQDYNYFFNPYGTIISKSSSGSYNFTDFKTQTGQDANSISKSNWLTYTDEAEAEQEVKLYTNETDSDTTIIAPSGYEDIEGNDVSSQELTVHAHYGLLILKS